MKYPPHLLSAAAPGYGGHWASCFARGERWLGRVALGPAKDVYPELLTTGDANEQLQRTDAAADD